MFEKTDYRRVELRFVPQKSKSIKITNSDECVQMLRHNWDKGKLEYVEQVKVVFLNNAAGVLGVYTFDGGTSNCIVDERIIFQAAILANASSIIICHNHPSASTKPSVADRDVTDRIKRCCQMFRMKLLDHIILTPSDHYSFSENGMI